MSSATFTARALLAASIVLSSGAARAAGDGPGPLLEVRSARTREPVAKAEVRFLDERVLESNATWLPMELVAGPGLVQRAAASGERLATDERGRVRLPRFEDKATLLVRCAGEAAALRLRAPCDPHVVVELAPDRDVVVRVNDAHGHPLSDVEVLLALPIDMGFADPIWRERTGTGESAGVARLPAASLPPSERPWTRGSAYVFPGCVRTVREQYFGDRIELHGTGDAPCEIALPATGTLRVTVTGGGSDVAGSHVSALEAPGLDRPLQPAEVAMALVLPTTVHARVEEGRATFPLVATKSTVALIWVGAGHLPVVRLVEGPLKEGDGRDVVLDVSAATPLAVVDGVAADRLGVPLANRDLSLELCKSSWGRSPQRRPLRCDATGHFTLADPQTIEYGASPPATSVRLLSEGPSARDLLASYLATLPPPDERRLRELGALLLVAPPIWIEGRVVDETGAPLDALVSIRLGAGGNAEHGETRAAWRDEWRDLIDKIPPPGAESIDGGWRVRSGADGRFALFGNPRANAVQLTAEQPGYRDAELTVSQTDPTDGSSPFVTLEDVVMKRLTTAHGVVVVDPGVPPSLFTLEFSGLAVLEPDAPGRSEKLERTPGPDGSFTLPRLGAGRLRWKAKLTGRSEVVQSGHWFLPVPSREEGHFFLPRLSLAGAVPLVRLDIVPVDPAPRLVAWVEYRNAPTEKWESAAGDLDHGFVVPRTGPATEALIRVAKHRLVHLQDLSADQKVELRSGIPVQLSADFESPLPLKAKLRFKLKPALDPSEAADERLLGREEKSELVPADAPHSRFALLRGGTYKVDLAIDPDDRGFARDLDLKDVRIEVADTDLEQEFAVHVTDAELARVLDR